MIKWLLILLITVNLNSINTYFYPEVMLKRPSRTGVIVGSAGYSESNGWKLYVRGIISW